MNCKPIVLDLVSSASAFGSTIVEDILDIAIRIDRSSDCTIPVGKEFVLTSVIRL